MLEINNIYNLDCREGLKLLEDNSIDCCITSPPYWGLRDYGVPVQKTIGGIDYMLFIIPLYIVTKQINIYNSKIMNTKGGNYFRKRYRGRSEYCK